MPRKSMVALACLALVSGAAMLAPSDDKDRADPRYEPVADWPRLPGNLKLGPVAGVATDASGRVYVFHRGKQPILVFDREGKFLRSWGDGLVKTAHGLRVDRDNNVWITDIGNHTVTKFDAQGKVLLTLGKKDQPGEGTDQFNKPTDIAVAAGGEIYVSDGYGNSRVMKFTREGRFLKQWGKKGTGAGEFDLPHAVVLDARGHVYVGDRENNRIQVFDGDGKFLAQWKNSGAPYGLYRTAPGRMFVADGRAFLVTVLDDKGQQIARWGKKGSGPGQFGAPHGVCVDSEGSVYVADTGNKRVLKFQAQR